MTPFAITKPQPAKVVTEQEMLNPPAFPRPTGYNPMNNVSNESQEGLCLRDYFAGQAVIGILAAAKPKAAVDIAHEAYIMADALMVERQEYNKIPHAA